MRHIYSVLLLFLIALPIPALAEKRVALVVGNADYTVVNPLENPVRDAKAIAAKLESLGFQVIEGYDLDTFSMQMKIRDFARHARTADMNLFYYAGHGLGVQGKNYVLPVDVRFEDPAALEFEAIELATITRQMEASNGVSLVFLDACRDDPNLSQAVSRTLSSGTRAVSVGRGLVPVEVGTTGKGTAIAFATSPGEVAYDGDGQHSPFTEALLEHIDRPNTGISEIMAHVTGDVRKSTNDLQKPWLRASLTGPVFLNKVEEPPQIQVPTITVPTTPNLAATPDPAPGGSDLPAQQALFAAATASDRVEDYEAYLQIFPNGLFALLASNAIKRLEEENATVEVASVPRGTSNIEEPIGPLVLTVTPALKAMPATQYTEQTLGLDWAKRRELQARLNLDGVNVGRADGAIGPNTRRGIQEWQLMRGLVPTGYLNNPQLQLLMVRTESNWLAWSAQNPVRSRTSSSGTRTQRKSNVDPGAVMLGVGAAILGAKILSR